MTGTGAVESYATKPDSELVRRLQEEDRKAFQEIFNRYKNRVFTICLRMTTNHDDASDLSQDAFIRMFDKIGSLKNIERFTSWLDRLTVNVVLGYMRSRKRVVLMDHQDETSAEAMPLPVVKPKRTMESMAVERAIEQLPDGYRVVFLLNRVYGYTHQEIAERLGCSVSTSKTQLFKARRKLLSLLS